MYRAPQMSHRVLSSQDELTAYLHHTRHRIVWNLVRKPATVSQLADQIGVHPANLTRHIRTLENAGLIELVEKRDTGRNLEKYYSATSSSFEVAHNHEAMEAPHKIGLRYVRSDIDAAINRLPDENVNQLMCQSYLSRVRISAQRRKRFVEELEDLVERYMKTETASGDAYHLAIGFYPGDESPIEVNETIQLKRQDTTSK